MMSEINLLARYPKHRRNVGARASAKTPEHIRISRLYGKEYFDGERSFGYGGYRYDGRWKPVAEDIIKHFALKPGDRILDVGCAKGFLVKDLMLVLPGIEAFGLDISDYAVKHCETEVVGRLHCRSADELPFPDHCFDAVISINTLHNLPRPECVKALSEIERVAKSSRAYVQVDSYFTEDEKRIFEEWVLTAHTHDFPDGWRQIFSEAGYRGDYFWTFV
jgi:SAM-dependent methyltransferase